MNHLISTIVICTPPRLMVRISPLQLSTQSLTKLILFKILYQSNKLQWQVSVIVKICWTNYNFLFCCTELNCYNSCRNNLRQKWGSGKNSNDQEPFIFWSRLKLSSWINNTSILCWTNLLRKILIAFCDLWALFCIKLILFLPIF